MKRGRDDNDKLSWLLKVAGQGATICHERVYLVTGGVKELYSETEIDADEDKETIVLFENYS
ncbi:hypothetical protein DMB45_05730 [Sanguibacteroides justesenii]|uniref:hypothetical protein n=1 Tax=Sanguibacteroides justesenii TaxID=1547597 RepID=UPI000D94BA64|nr:hypothetical protein [Sanguibacteroides justesenii]PXZ44161.1 hypothetical protein DMB45_05730 [Sanguibacteroides justesenii]